MKKITLAVFVVLVSMIFIFYKFGMVLAVETNNMPSNAESLKSNLKNGYKEIYLAGGCFWGVEKYFESIKGVVATDVGYANGYTENPSYEDVVYRNTNHAETVHIVYNPEIVSLPFILDMYYKVIDPLSINRQGNDRGTQYRTGIYYTNDDDKITAQKSLQKLSETLNGKKPAIELKTLINYYKAEEYNQFLNKDKLIHHHLYACQKS